MEPRILFVTQFPGWPLGHTLTGGGGGVRDVDTTTQGIGSWES